MDGLIAFAALLLGFCVPRVMAGPPFMAVLLACTCVSVLSAREWMPCALLGLPGDHTPQTGGEP